MNIRKPIDYSTMYKGLDILLSAELSQMKLYCEIGKLISARPEKGAAVAAAEYLGKTYPDVSGFSPRNLRRMRDFCRAYEDAPEVLTEAMTIGWTQNVAILEGCEGLEERGWYIRAVQQFGWAKAELLERIAGSSHKSGAQILRVEEVPENQAASSSKIIPNTRSQTDFSRLKLREMIYWSKQLPQNKREDTPDDRPAGVWNCRDDLHPLQRCSGLSPLQIIGKDCVSMKKLGFGLMRLPLLDPANEASMDMEQVKNMVDLFLEKGFTYFDTAWMYQGFASESAAKEALVDRHPRNRFTLATKLHAGFFHSSEEREKLFNAQLEKTGAGYFDYYLLHDVDAGSYPKFEEFDCFGWLLDKKAQGLIRHAGFSYHDSAELLDEILSKHPETEFVQLQINYLDWDSEWIQSRKCYEVCVKHKKPVIVMEPVKGGTLARVPQEAEALFRGADPEMSTSSWAIRFAASLPNVMMVLSGMSSLEQVKDNLSYMADFTPLTEDETALCHQATGIINSQIAVPCTGCSYCTSGCPKHIAIPQYFSLYNEITREDMEHKGWTVSFSNYDALAQKFGKAADCIACGQCERICPQRLTIVDYLKAVSARFDHL